MQPRRSRARWWAWLVPAMLLGVAAAMAERSIQPPPPATGEGADLPGIRAVVDPRTGQVTANPSRAQLQALALTRRSAALSRSTVGLRPFDLSRGGRGVNLQGRFDSALRVERSADGSFHVTCGDPAHGEGPHSHQPAAGDRPAAPSSSSPAPVQ